MVLLANVVCCAAIDIAVICSGEQRAAARNGRPAVLLLGCGPAALPPRNAALQLLLLVRTAGGVAAAAEAWTEGVSELECNRCCVLLRCLVVAL